MEKGSLDDGGGGDGWIGDMQRWSMVVRLSGCDLGAILVRTSQCNLGAISVVQRDLGRGGGGRGGTIWAGLGLAGRLELGVEQCVELRLVCGLELK